MLKFLGKIAGQHVLSMPSMRHLYRPLQKRISRSLVVNPATVRQKVVVGTMYLDRIAGAGLGNLIERDPILDFGGGWHLTIPLLYARLGAKSQIITDVRRLAFEEVVFATAGELNRLTLDPRPSHPLPRPSNDQSLDGYLKPLGIRYEAPTSLPLPIESASIGSVLCTVVLSHPPRRTVRAIFEEMARVLKPGGLVAVTIHLFDMYAILDPSLSRFNFLRYSAETWERWFNNSHMSYNRLRASDYANLLYDLPFKKLIWEPTPPSPDDIAELSRIKVHPEFDTRDLIDLASTHLFFVLQKDVDARFQL